jgi:hypothetical protein
MHDVITVAACLLQAHRPSGEIIELALSTRDYNATVFGSRRKQRVTDLRNGNEYDLDTIDHVAAGIPTYAHFIEARAVVQYDQTDLTLTEALSLVINYSVIIYSDEGGMTACPLGMILTFEENDGIPQYARIYTVSMPQFDERDPYGEEGLLRQRLTRVDDDGEAITYEIVRRDLWAILEQERRDNYRE